MRGKLFRLTVALAALLTVSGTAQAALIDRGGGFIYDDVLNVTWTQDANINGLDTWANQVAWAAGLSIVDTRPGAGNVTYSDWRLPSMDVNGDNTIVDCATATEPVCRDNEYGHLFWQDGVTSATPGLFTNVQSGGYWSGTQFAPDPSRAWSFIFGTGLVDSVTEDNVLYPWLLRPGNLPPLPVPGAVWLFGSSLLGLLGLAQHKRRPDSVFH